MLINAAQLKSLRLAQIVVISLLVAVLAACGGPKGGAPITTAAGEGTYTVQRGDTLYSIARRHGQSVDELMRMNSLRDAHRIRVGQVLRVRGGAGVAPAAGTGTAQAPAQSTAASVAAPRNIRLVWPAKGAHRRGTGNQSQGVFIRGAEDDPVYAAAAGRVMYAGSGLRGYGNMIIISHEDQFLTIYAHNKALLAKEGQQVKQGDLIARMGQSDSPQVQLYFELRYDGKAVDATRYLPK